MNIIDVATWVTLACLPAFLLLDMVYRARRFQTPRFWRVRALVVTLFIFGLSFAVPMLWSRLSGRFRSAPNSPIRLPRPGDPGRYWKRRKARR